MHQLNSNVDAVNAIVKTPGALRLFAVSVLARFPLAMVGIALLVHARRIGGSYAAAGVVSGASAVALGVGGPLLGRLVDRRGQRGVLLAGACFSAALLVALALLPVGAPLPLLVGLAVALGLATPPLGACVRTVFPELIQDPAALRAAYAVDATAVELTWVLGPPAALGIGALGSSGAALLATALLLLGGSAGFVAQPVSRAWRPAGGEPRRRGGSLRTPAMRTLVAVLVAVGVVFGAAEVAVTAAAEALGHTAAAGPLLGLWGVGSLLGGVVAVRLGGGAHSAAGLSLMLAALALGHLALAPAAASVLALGPVLVFAGAAIAPTYASVFAMVEHAAPAGTVTEAFAWLGTAIAVGAAVGAAAAGALADSASPAAAFVLAGGAGAVAALITALRSRSLADEPERRNGHGRVQVVADQSAVGARA